MWVTQLPGNDVTLLTEPSPLHADFQLASLEIRRKLQGSPGAGGNSPRGDRTKINRQDREHGKRGQMNVEENLEKA